MKKIYLTPECSSAEACDQPVMLPPGANMSDPTAPSNYGNFGRYGSFEEDEDNGDDRDDSHLWDRL